MQQHAALAKIELHAVEILYKLARSKLYKLYILDKFDYDGNISTKVKFYI